jgi:drug/metabolite transporter (DMT)-like permease
MTSPRNTTGLLLAFFGMVLFAGTLPATRLAVQGFDPLFLTAMRITIAGAAAALALIVMRRRIPSREKLIACFVAGLFTVALFPLCAALAMMSVPAAHGGVVMGILPLATAIAAALLAKERPSFGFWITGVIGSALVVAFMIRDTGVSDAHWGDLFLLATVVFGGIGYTLSGKATALMPGWEVISWSVVMYAPLTLIATILLWPANIAAVPAPQWGALFYVALVSQYLSFFVYNVAMLRIGVARAGQMLLLQPFTVVALAWPVNGEPIALKTLAFAAAVVVVVMIGQRMRVTRG